MGFLSKLLGSLPFGKPKAAEPAAEDEAAASEESSDVDVAALLAADAEGEAALEETRKAARALFESDEAERVSEAELAMMHASGLDEEPVHEGVIQEYEDYERVDEEEQDALGEEYGEEERARLKERQKAFDKQVNSDESRIARRAMDSAGKDIDDEISRLLDVDQGAEAEIAEKARKAEEARLALEAQNQLEDENGGGDVHKQRVYVQTADEIEQERRAAEAALPRAARLKLAFGRAVERVPARTFRIVLIAQAAALIMGAVVITVRLLQRPPSPYTYQMSQTAAAAVVPNDARLALLNITTELDGAPVTLERMVFDGLGTVFYLNGLEAARYDAWLLDDKGRLCVEDATFPRDASTLEGARAVLHFQPFEEGAAGFHLFFDNRESGERSLAFSCKLPEAREETAARYTLAEAEMPPGCEDLSAEVKLARFSASGSELLFAMHWEKEGGGLFFPVDAAGGLTTMDQAVGVAASRPMPDLYAFEANKTLAGRMDFAPVRDLNARTQVTIRGLFRKIALDESVALNALFAGGDGARARAGRYDICLDKLRYGAGKFYLSTHTENRLIPAYGDESDRVEGYVDAALALTGSNGVTVEMPGEARYDKRGAELVFDAAPAIAAFGAASIADMDIRLNIRAANVAIGDVHITLEPYYGYPKGYAAQEAAAAFEARLAAAFGERLAGIGGEASLPPAHEAEAREPGEEDGEEAPPPATFAQNVLDDPALSALYAPREHAAGAAYALRLLALADDPTNIYARMAVVQETWVATGERQSAYFTRTHKILCDTRGGGCVIVSDEIVGE